MSDARARPLAPLMSRGRARALPWLTVIAGSVATALVPVVAPVPLLPPGGLLMRRGWRLLVPHSLRRWAAAPLGFVDDLVSGQPLGSAVLLWSLAFLLIDLLEQRLVFRDFWQDWLIGAGALIGCVLGGRLIAVPLGAAVDAPLAGQALATVLLFPAATRLVAWIDAKRNYA